MPKIQMCSQLGSIHILRNPLRGEGGVKASGYARVTVGGRGSAAPPTTGRRKKGRKGANRRKRNNTRQRENGTEQKQQVKTIKI